MTITIIGLGLIGGSLGLDLHLNGFASRRVGVDSNPLHCEQALALGLVEEVMPLETACQMADLVVLAVPVNAILQLLPTVLNLVSPTTTVTDMGSTKGQLLACVAGHPNRVRYVAAHPMAGTEFSGPAAAVNHLFYQKNAIICDAHLSDPNAVTLVERLFKSLFMRITHMDGQSHDLHAAYVSHISHISSFALALTVLDKEKSEKAIFDLASGGFASTVRLAKSSPRMWRDVFEQNSEHLLDVLDQYLAQVTEFRNLIALQAFDTCEAQMSKANDIGRILEG